MMMEAHARIDETSKRIDVLRVELNKEKENKRIVTLESELNKRIDETNKRIDGVYGVLGGMQKTMACMHMRPPLSEVVERAFYRLHEPGEWKRRFHHAH